MCKQQPTGSAVIGGDYQHRALMSGPPIQRFWHHAKQLSVAQFLPPPHGTSVIDVGCGSGVLTSYLGSFGSSALGIDVNREAVEFASRTYGSRNVRFEARDAEEKLGEPGSIDAIYCLEVIEHVPIEKARKMMQAFHSALKPGGKLFLSTPNYRSFWPAIEWFLDTTNKAPRMKGEQHVEFYRARKLRRLCEDSGFVVERLWTALFLAPFLAPVAWRLAERLHRLEASLPLVGALLMCIVVKPETTG